MSDFHDWEERMAKLDERLHPIATRPVDITIPGWYTRLQGGQAPLEEAHVQEPSQVLLTELIAAYGVGSERIRQEIRQLFVKYRSFAWAATLTGSRETAASLREHLILFSMKDQGRDSRDALLLLQEIYRDSAGVSVDISALLKEVAGMSSTTDRFGMGSTREMLLKYAGRNQ